MSSNPACKNPNPGRVPLWHAAWLLVIALVSIASAGCALSSDVSLPALPNAPIRGFNITTTTLSPSVAFDTSSYSATISTFGGVTPLTNCAVTLNVPAGFTMAPLTGMVNPANASQCIISGVISVSPAPPAGGLVVQVVVGAADSSTPALTDTETYTLTIQPGFAINVFVMANGTEGRAYNLPVTTTLGTGGVAPLNAVNGCVLAAHSGPLPTGMTIARNPGNTNQCLFAGTPGAGTAGTYNIAITARDSAATPNVSTFPAAPTTVTLVINPPLTIPAYAPTAGTVNTAGYLFTVPTLGGQAPVTCSGTAPAGLTIGTAANGRDCEITGTPTAAVVNGAVSVTVTDSATATTAAGMATVGSTLTVNPAATTTTITSDVPDPTATGEAYVVSWSVNAVAPATDLPTAKTGNVTVADGDGNTCTAAVGAGSCSLTSTLTGVKTLTATYAGDANFTGSNGTTSHTVQGASTTTTITSDTPDPSVTGQTYAVNWTVTVNPPGAGTPTGTVTVDDGQGGTCSAAVAAGTCSLATTTAGVKTLTANYSGDANFNASSDTEVHTVNPAATTTTITSDTPDPSVVGETYAVGWAVTVNAPGAGVPTGTVTVADGDGNTCAAAVAAGTCNITSTLAGAKTLTATYSGDADFAGSAGNTAHTVNPASTTTTITSDVPDPTTTGETYAVTWTVVVNAPGAGVPTGNVTIDDGDGNTCTAAVAAGTCNITSTLAGVKTLTANYSGDANFSASSDTDTHTVSAAPTTTTITNAATITAVSTSAGEPYAVSWSVTVNPPGMGTPTGTVTVSDGTASCNAPVAAGTCNLASFTVGVVNVTATYSGDANFAASASAAAPHTVTPAATTTTITSDAPDPSVVGQGYTVAWTVAVVPPGAGTPTGNVTVSDGDGNTCTAPVAAGSCVLTSTLAGVKLVSANYLGDGNYLPSLGTDAHTVNPAATTTTITSDTPDPSQHGETYTVSWLVTVNAPGSGVPTGTVTVDDGAGNTCNAPVAVGSCSLLSFPAGAFTLTANYSGDLNFTASADTEAHTVVPGATTTTITSDAPDPTVTGESYTVTWSVAVAAPATLQTSTITGNVTVSDGTDSCTAAVAAGTCNIISTTAGAKTLTATYSGDANFATSNGTTAHTVNQASTTTLITSDVPDPTVTGEVYTVSWTVTVNAPGAGTPTGTVTVDDGDGNTCNAAVAAGSCSLASTLIGTKTLTANYSGDANFTASSDTDTHDVNAAATTTTITADTPDPSVHGQTYSVSVTVAPVAPSTGTPTGTVNVDDGAGGTCVITLAGGTGSCNLNTFPVGGYTVTATYVGTASFTGSSDTEAHTVNQANVTVTVDQGSPNPTVPGEAYTVSWTVTVAAPGTLQTSTITGNVTVDDGDGNNCTAAVAVGSCSITSTTAGAKTLTANYDGSADPNFNSGSGTNTHTVNQGATTVTITNAASLAAVDTVTGEVYAVNWTVAINAPATGTLTGTVTVSDGIAGTCTVAVALNTCNIATRAAGGGPKTITVTYNGDANFATSNNTATHTVNKSTTGMGIPNTSPDPSVVGEPYTVTFAAFITDAGAGTLTGTLTADDGEGNTCTATLPTLTCQMIGTSPGTKNLTGSYSGDADFAAIAASPLATHDVNAADTTTTITSDAPDPSAVNASYTVSWTVTANAPSVAPPPTITGTVTVDDGDGNTCNAPVATGSCSIMSTSGGVKTLTANYSGDGNFNASSDTESHTVALTVNVPTIGNMTELRAVTTPAVFTTDSGPNLVSCTPTPALPAGVTLAPVGTTCELAGTPAAATAGTYVFTVTADNGATSGTSGNASLTINAAMAITPASPLTNSRQNSTYTLAIGSTGGQPTRTVSNPGGSGVSLNTGDAECAGMFFNTGTQQIEGTPTATGVCSFTLDVTDSASTTTPAATNSFPYQITVDPALAIPTATDLKNALRNSPYTSGNITVTNSLGTVSWTVTVGDFAGTTGNGGCSGLSVGATGTTTTVTGTPTSAGPTASSSATCGTGNAAGSTFTLQASDIGSGPVGPGTATATFRVRVFGTWLYVADPANDTVEVIDSTSNAHVATLTLTAGDNPHSVAVSPDGSRAFVTLEGSNEVLVINTFDNTSLGTVDISLNPAGNVDACTGPRGIAIGKAGNALNRAYVACTSGDVDVLDVTAAVGAGMRIETVNSVSSGGQPRDLAVNPAGTFVYVSMSGDRHIEMISTVPGTLTGTELTDVMPVGAIDMRGVMFSANGARLYIADQALDDIFVLETATDTVNTGLTITFAAGNPERMALSADGTRVFVTFSGTVEQLVVIVDGATPVQDTGSPVALTANDDAVGVAAPPSGGLVYLALSGADAVGRRNSTTPFAAGANITLPGGVASTPQGMAAMPIPQ